MDYMSNCENNNIISLHNTQINIKTQLNTGKSSVYSKWQKMKNELTTCIQAQDLES